jgi:peptidoglycan/xylan/chitin deacetylase (PgdA/CDA1 family)
MTPTVERIAISALFAMQAHRLARLRRRHDAAIVMYHGFTDQDSHEGIANHEQKHLHARSFETQLRYLRADYRILPLADVIRAYAAGTDLPARAVAITIDDGYRSVFRVAFPILKQLGLPATIYLATDFVHNQRWLWTDRVEYAVNHTRRDDLEVTLGATPLTLDLRSRASRIAADRDLRSAFKALPQAVRDAAVEQLEQAAECALGDGRGDTTLYDPLRWAEAAEMADSGLAEIGSHTHTHVILSRCDPVRVAHELRLSKQIIEHQLARSCTAFCYPNGRLGDFNAATRALLQEHGYTSGLTTVYGRNGRDTDVLALMRYNLGKPMVRGGTEVRVAGLMG